MARDFSKNTANYMSIGSFGSNLNGAAFVSVHCWANTDTIDTGLNDNPMVSVLSTASNSSMIRLGIKGNGGTKVLRAGGRPDAAETYRTADATSSFTTSTWHSCGAAYDFAGDAISPYFNGVQEGTASGAFTATSYTHGAGATLNDAIGSAAAAPISTATQFDGRIAELCIWFGSRALTAAEFGALADGVSPALIATSLGRAYFPLIGQGSSERDKMLGLTGTITGTVAAAAHPRMYYPSARVLQFPATAAASPKWPSSLLLTGVGF